MKDYVTKIAIFLSGVAAGAAISWKYLESKYKKIAQEEIDSVKEVYSNREKKQKEEKKIEHFEAIAEKKKAREEDMEEAKSIISESGYAIEHSDIYQQVKEGKYMADRPYVIPPEEFGENPYYDAISLNYYADGILTDDTDEPIEDIDGLIGEDALTHFGEYEDDSVFVRDDDAQVDYEILLDQRRYADRMED